MADVAERGLHLGSGHLGLPRIDDLEEGEDLEVPAVEGDEAADAGGLEGHRHGRVQDVLASEPQPPDQLVETVVGPRGRQETLPGPSTGATRRERPAQYLAICPLDGP